LLSQVNSLGQGADAPFTVQSVPNCASETPARRQIHTYYNMYINTYVCTCNLLYVYIYIIDLSYWTCRSSLCLCQQWIMFAASSILLVRNCNPLYSCHRVMQEQLAPCCAASMQHEVHRCGGANGRTHVGPTTM
jgi:hypothetical protein